MDLCDVLRVSSLFEYIGDWIHFQKCIHILTRVHLENGNIDDIDFKKILPVNALKNNALAKLVFSRVFSIYMNICKVGKIF